MGRVCHDPRLSGHGRHNPRKTAAGPRGMGATTPVYRGMGATTPKQGHAYRRVLAATRHTVNVASITRGRAERAGQLGDSFVMPLLGTLSQPLVGGGACRVTGGADEAGEVRETAVSGGDR